MSRLAGAAAVAALAGAAAVSAGCGSSSTAPSTPSATKATSMAAAPAAAHQVVERSYGKGANRVWVFRRKGEKPRAVVIFLHGLYDMVEATPANHLDWLRHLARQGNAVLYPQFEARPGAQPAVLHALKGVIAGMQAVNPVVTTPVVVIGYSRGAGLALDVAALAPQIHVNPRAVLSVFPAMLDPPLDFSKIPAGTKIVFLVGDNDTAVSHIGRDRLVAYLQQTHFPLKDVSTEVVRSTPTFKATHESPMLDTAGAHAAFWDRADRVVDNAVKQASR